jgi:hypothetical protein
MQDTEIRDAQKEAEQELPVLHPTGHLAPVCLARGFDAYCINLGRLPVLPPCSHRRGRRAVAPEQAGVALESLATAAAWVLVAGEGPDEDMACGGQWCEGAGAGRRCQRGGLGGTVAGRGGGMAVGRWRR